MNLPPAQPAGSPAARIEIAPGVYAPVGALRWQFSRSGGPGGQNVNKVNTRAELWVPLTSLQGFANPAIQRLGIIAPRHLTQAGEIHISAETHRTQEGNKTAVLQRLRDLLVHAMHQPKARRRTRPTVASKRRRLDSKKHRGHLKANRHRPGESS